MKQDHILPDKGGETKQKEIMRIINKGGEKTPPATNSTDAMDTEEGDAITKMILDKTKRKAERRQRRVISMGWDLDIDDIPRPLSIPLPESREKGNV